MNEWEIRKHDQEADRFIKNAENEIRKAKRIRINALISKGNKRSFRYRRVYGIWLRDYRRILNEQNHRCKICGAEADKNGKLFSTRERLSVDHCHTTGEVRGLLCGLCNKGLGQFKDDEQRLVQAMEYLKKSKRGLP